MKVGDPGTVMLWLRGEVPEGWVTCDGKVYHRSASEECFSRLSKLPTSAAKGDPADCFRVPNAEHMLSKTLLQLIIKF